MVNQERPLPGTIGAKFMIPLDQISIWEENKIHFHEQNSSLSVQLTDRNSNTFWTFSWSTYNVHQT